MSNDNGAPPPPEKSPAREPWELLASGATDSPAPAEPPAAEEEWVEVSPPPTPTAPEPPAEGQVTESPIPEEPAEPITPVAVDESAPMAQPVGEPPEAKDEPPQEAKERTGSYLVVRYGLMQQLGEFSHDLPQAPMPNSKVVVRTDRGVELGDVVVTVSTEPTWRCVTSSRLRDYLRASGPDYPFTRGGKVLRAASPQDIIDFRHLATAAHEASTYCRQQIRELNVAMRLVTVEHLLGGERIIFYFSSEARVDFRELVRRLAAQFRTRIEMRQVGARDEARLVGDYERCGQRVCCQEYLKDLRPVSMRMAKTQKATLDPSKISGRCGRLMCCLRYEDTVYEDLRKRLPRKNIWVRTEKLVGKVIDVQIITQLVRLLLPDYTQVVVPLEEILERDVPAPAIPAAPTREAPRERPERRLLRDENAQARAPEKAALPSAAPPVVEPVPGAVNEDEQVPVAAPPDEPSEGPELADEGAGEEQRPADGTQANGPTGQGQGDRPRRRRRRGRRGGGDPQTRGQGQRQGQAPPRPSGGEARPMTSQPQGSGGNGGGQGPQGDGHRRRRRRGRRGGGGGNSGGGDGNSGGGAGEPGGPPNTSGGPPPGPS